MQASARTPNSILRRRLDKENEETGAKATKRCKLANRRVSFAPDEELETKHIFKEDDQHSTGDMQLSSPAHDTGMRSGVGAASGIGLAAPTSHVHEANAGSVPLDVLPSPDGLSPLSMDLTNNSSAQQGDVAPSVPGRNTGACHIGLASVALPPTQQNQQLQHHHHNDYTRNITMKLPNLSTLVEEDEDCYSGGDANSGPFGDLGASMSPRQLVPAEQEMGLRRGCGGPMHEALGSPISPYVLREMQLGKPADAHKMWGFTPGAEDTMEVDVGRVVMGEATYNNVYGTGPTGEVTMALKEGYTAGLHVRQHRPLTKLPGHSGAAPGPLARPQSPGGGNMDQPYAKAVGAAEPNGRFAAFGSANPPSQEAGPGPSTALAAAAPGPLASMPAAAMQHLQQQQQHINRVSQPQPALAPLPLLCRSQPQDDLLGPIAQQMQAPAQNTLYLDNTTKLLDDDHTDAWRLPGQGGNYDRRRLSVASNKVVAPGYRRGVAGGPGGAGAAGETTMLLGPATQPLGADTVGAATVQLLADTTNQGAYERLLRKMPSQQEPLSVAPPIRRGVHVGLGEATAVSSSAADPHRLSPQPSGMSLDLHAAGNSTGNDLLSENGGLSLDAFALPPEPTINLMAQAPVGKAAAASGPGRAVAPKITCQDFLTLIEISFNEKVCRTSYLPQSDPPPKTVGEIYEAATVMTAHMTVCQNVMIDVSERISNMQSRVQEQEAELTASNPELFSEVQLATPSQLETIKDQFIMLKKLCRIRTVRAIKQLQLSSLDNVLTQLAERKADLQQELAAMTADAGRLEECVRRKDAITAAIARRIQEDEERRQEAVEKKKAAESLFQRLQTLRAQNQERVRRIEEARQKQREIEQNRVPKEVLERECRTLKERCAALAASSELSALTPGREGQLARQVAKKREEVEMLLSLHALRIDITGMEFTGRYCMVYRGTYNIACTRRADMCEIEVELPDSSSSFAALAPSIVSMIRASAAALSCRIPRTQLPQRLEVILEQLHRMSRLARHLESGWFKHNYMLKPVIESGSDGSPILLLEFLNANTVTKLSIRMPWQGALTSDLAAPPLLLQMDSLESPEAQQQSCDALYDNLLSRVEPGPEYVKALCVTMDATLRSS